MHFVTGGAYNGKRRWTETFYNIEHQAELLRLSAFENRDLGKLSRTNSFRTLTWIEGVEFYVKLLLEAGGGPEEWRKWLTAWLGWERAGDDHCVVVMGSDMSKGIVPAVPFERKWRDEVGRFYQELVEESSRVDVIWYGIAKTIKNGGNHRETLYENRRQRTDEYYRGTRR
jgi:hypothetical protein